MALRDGEISTLREQATVLKDEIDRRIKVEEGLSDQLASETRRGSEGDHLFQLLVASVTDHAIFMLDRGGHVTTWNPGAERPKGYTAHDAIGLHFSRFYPDEDIREGKCERELVEATTTGRCEDEGWRIRKDGTRFWAHVTITPVYDHGHHVGFAKVTHDLTARRQEEATRLAAQERFRMLVESVHDYALLVLDPEGRITTWNAGAERIKGYRADEIIGRHFSCFYPPEDIAAGKCEHELAVATAVGRFEDESWRLRKDGTRFWANVVISAIRDATGALVGFSKVTRDLTERRHSEEERARRLAAEHENRVKDEFLAMLGHELRNPLAPIVTALQLIRLRGHKESMKEHQIIERQVQHMMHLVDDLLDVSRISTGKIELRQQHLDMREVIARAIEIVSPLLEQRAHHFLVDVPDRPFGVHGDDVRLTQIFTNLLTNAARYTPHGGHIVLAMHADGDRVTVSVRDDGCGIDKELLPRVFDLFVQGYQRVDRATGGLGLGLTLVRSLVALHDGTVEAQSEGPGLGSCFSVHLPAISGLAGYASAPAEPSPPRTSRRILLVDDNDDARLLMAEILLAKGHEVRTAATGPAALVVIETFHPEVAVLDIGLPDMDGYELAAKLRDTLQGAMPRLISLTGYGQQSDRDRSHAAGFELHLVKPVDLRQLLNAIQDPGSIGGGSPPK